MRTWELTAEELAELIERLRQDDLQYQELDEWSEVLRIYSEQSEGAPVRFTIRYIGTVRGPGRPIDRHISDIKYRTGGILGEFLNAVETWFPHIAEKAAIYLLPDAYQDPDTAAHFEEDTERLLIEFFHQLTLLNRQRGGYYSSYLPNDLDADTFRDFKTDAWSGFRQNCTVTSDKMLESLDAHFMSVQGYANDYPGESGTARHEFTDKLRDVTMKQATPHQYLGNTVLLFIGKDITLTDYCAEETFMTGGSRSGVLTRDIISCIVRAEAQANDRDYQLQAFRPDMSLWCFVDL